MKDLKVTRRPYMGGLVLLHDTMTGADFYALRKRAKLSLRAIGEGCGLSRTTIMHIEEQEYYYTTPERRVNILEAYEVRDGNDPRRLHEALTGGRQHGQG